jgi:uncharacterized protein
MKLQADRIDGRNAIARHGAGGVIVNGVEHCCSVVVPWQGQVARWPVDDFAVLSETHFTMLRELNPDVVIFGSGARLRFAHPELMRALIEARIGIETMDTAAACRTYNVLLLEGRAVVAALLFEPREAGAD